MRKSIIIFLLIYLVIIFMPPILHPAQYLVINNDTNGHLYAFNTIKEGNPQFLYLGQQITGYPLVWLEKVSNIKIDYLFMWFNFISLALAGIVTGTLIYQVTKSKMAGAISALVITFGVISTGHLFFCGTIFNIIDVLILFPLSLIFLHKYIESKKIYLLISGIGIGIFTLLYHPSLSGINYVIGTEIPRQYISYNPVEKIVEYNEAIINPITALFIFLGPLYIVFTIFCGILMKRNNIKLDTKSLTILAILTIIFFIMLIAGTSGISNFSSRIAVNYILILGIAMCILFGSVLRNITKWQYRGLSALAILGIIPNFSTWIMMYWR